MRIKPAIGSVVGPTSDIRWGQVLLTPHAYGVIEIEARVNAANETVMQRGIGVLTEITQKLTEKVVSLRDVELIAKEAIEHPGVATVLLLVPVGSVIYVVLKGEGIVYVKRKEALAALFSGEGAVSGEVQKNDTLLLASRSFMRVLPESELTTVFDHLSPTEIAEKLTLLLHEKSSDSFGAAALIFRVASFESLEQEDSPNDQKALIEQQPAERIALKHTPIFSQRIKNFITNGRVLRRSLGRIKSYIVHPTQLSSKAKAAIVVMLLGLFFISVGFGIVKQQGTVKNKAYEQKLSDAKHAFEEGIALLDLNAVKGRERLDQAKQITQELAATVPTRTKEGREVAALLRQITDNLTQAMQVVRGEPQLFFDVSLLKKGSLATSVAISGDTMGILDAPTQTVYLLSLATKNGRIVAGGAEFQGARLLAAHGDKLYVLVDGGVHEIRTVDRKVSPLLIKRDEEWGEIKGLFSYGGNVYLLDASKGRIWKYVTTETGFSDIREYLNPDTLPNFSQATGLAIDGSVWVGTSDGKTLRFTQGKENTFVSKGIEPPLGASRIVYTNDTTDHLYILDTNNKRVVVLEKEGAYISQYVWTNPIHVTDLVVSESFKTIFLLGDGKIYSLLLK